MKNQSEVIAEAIVKGGGVRRVAIAMKMSEEGVRLWRVRGFVPAKRLVEFARLTGVGRERLAPDLYADFPTRRRGSRAVAEAP
jgi:hypothetical protein